MNVPAAALRVVDIRDGGPPRHARERAAQARALRDACLGFFPPALRAMLPLLDGAARLWLKRSQSPYVAEIERIADTLGCSGVWLLNASCHWACTALAREQDGVPWLARTLDWPFAGLGRRAEAAHMRGPAGDFCSITWPGYVGVLTAMAPRRFAACLNHAPARRRFAHPWLRPYDYAVNTLSSSLCKGRLPADQLLRQTFEKCADYRQARQMLETTPVARPAIYTLVGCAPGERCVVERTETGFATRAAETVAANDWRPMRPGWEGRIGTRQFLKLSLAQAAGQSRARCEALAQWNGSLADCSFAWLREPVLNPYTRLATTMCPAAGILRAVGYEVMGGNLPEPVTQPLTIALAPARSPFETSAMKIVDLSHTMSIHTPGWVGYAGNKMYYAQNLQTQGIVAQRIETSLHAGTHFDGAMHATDGRSGDMASLPLDFLVNHGVVVDLSPQLTDWSVITPPMIEKAGADIREGDIVILHTGWHKYYEGQTQQDLVRYFCYHPGPTLDTLEWMLKKKIKWFGMDTGSCDHPMNTSIRNMRPDIAREFAEKTGKTPAEFFGTFEYTHKRSGRKVSQNIFPFHNYAFQEGLLHAENLGGDLPSVLGRRCIIGAFPWRYEGLESCPCRILAIFDAGNAPVEALGNAARGIVHAASNADEAAPCP